MNILVIGNGFDIEHGLRTSYVDFIYFCNCIADCGNFIRSCGNEGKGSDYDNKLTAVVNKLTQYGYSDAVLEKFIALISRNEMIEFTEKCEDNFWLQYVNGQNKENPTWCHFEELIADYLDMLVWLEKKSHRIQELTEKESQTVDKILEQIETGSKKNLEEHKAYLLKELDNLIFLLHFYLSNFLDDHIDERPLFKKLRVDRIINFNYTSTYRKVYGEMMPPACIHFIHGRICSDGCRDSNMILGIGTELKHADRESLIGYAGFQKYFQRIIKRTGNTYRNWIGNTGALSKIPKIKDNVIVFGHSFDIPDSDIIKAIVQSARTRVHIFYHNEESLRSIVINLVKIFSQDEVIELTGSGKIQFLYSRDSNIDHVAETLNNTKVDNFLT